MEIEEEKRKSMRLEDATGRLESEKAEKDAMIRDLQQQIARLQGNSLDGEA